MKISAGMGGLVLFEDCEVIEAALFTAGRSLTLKELARVVGRDVRVVRKAVAKLLEDYQSRRTSLEIIELGDGYLMQVKPQIADRVRDLAPRELSSPVLRTLAMVAYYQPITLARLAIIRGNQAYSHIRELEERGLIKTTPKGRTRLLETTPRFAEYFGLSDDSPQAVREKILELAREQGLELGGKIGVTPMYRSLMELAGIRKYAIVNPYSGELENLKLLVLAPGYRDRINNYQGEIIEAKATTFQDLAETLESLARYGDRAKVEASLERIKKMRENYLSRAMGIHTKVQPVTEMAARIIQDLRLNISPQGLRVAPDYKETGKGEKIGEADILIPTHKNAPEDILERVAKRYETVIKELEKRETQQETNTENK